MRSAEGGNPPPKSMSDGGGPLGPALDRLAEALGTAIDDEAIDEEVYDVLTECRRAVNDARWWPPYKVDKSGKQVKPPPRGPMVTEAIKQATACAKKASPDAAAAIESAVKELQEAVDADGKPMAGGPEAKETEYPKQATGKGYTTATGRKIFK